MTVSSQVLLLIEATFSLLAYNKETRSLVDSSYMTLMSWLFSTHISQHVLLYLHLPAHRHPRGTVRPTRTVQVLYMFLKGPATCQATGIGQSSGYILALKPHLKTELTV